jgi:hypothetical protein
VTTTIMLQILPFWFASLLLGVPLFVGMALAAMAFAYLGGFPMGIVPQKIGQSANSFPLLAAPLFILMGNIMNSAGITDRIFAFATACVGWLRGGLCHANIFASASQVPLPHFGSNCAGSFASTGLRKLSTSGSITVMPALFSVSTSVPSCRVSSASCQVTPAAMAASTVARSAAERPCQKSSFTTTSRGVMMWPVRTRNFCTSFSLALWIVGRGFSCPSTAPWLRAR